MKNAIQTCRIHWPSHQKLPEISAELRSWLTETGSLTKRLRTVALDFQVKVLNETWQESTSEEIELLQSYSPELESIWTRETLLCDADQPLIFARSLFPASTLNGKGTVLKNLGSRSLGDFLFTDPNWHRDPFIFNYLSAQDFFCSHLPSMMSDSNQSFWARCSRFYFFNQPLIITEVFLPELISRIKHDAY